MFGVDVLTQPQIDAIVLDFPIFPAVANGGAQSRDFGTENRQKASGVFAPQICWGSRTKTPIGDKLFQHIPPRVATFRENRPRDVENLVEGKKNKKLECWQLTCQFPT